MAFHIIYTHHVLIRQVIIGTSSQLSSSVFLHDYPFCKMFSGKYNGLEVEFNFILCMS